VTRRGLWIAGSFIAFELLVDLVLGIVRQHYHIEAGSLWWVDFVICPLFGLIIILAGRVTFPAAVVSGAALGLTDGTVGLFIVRALGGMKDMTPQIRLATIITGVTFHPLMLATLTAVGAGVAVGLRSLFAPPTPAQ
jgi:hypothetical protein